MIVDNSARIYPCAECGLLRSKEEGGTIFTVCDGCWDKAHPPRAASLEPSKELEESR